MGKRYTLLLADDDAQLQSAVKRVAENLGHHVIQSLRGTDVVVLAAKHEPDLIVLDLGFCHADGRDLLSQLKSDENARDIPVLVWSGRNDDDSKRIALELGAEDFVEKFDAQTLLRKVERVLLHYSGPSVSGTRRIGAEVADDAEQAPRGHRTG